MDGQWDAIVKRGKAVESLLDLYCWQNVCYKSCRAELLFDFERQNASARDITIAALPKMEELLNWASLSSIIPL